MTTPTRQLHTSSSSIMKLTGHNTREVPRPRFGTAQVWVESPLQLLSAVETHAAGLLGHDVRIIPRQGMPLEATTQALLANAPAGVSFLPPARKPPAPKNSADRFVVGDAYSGKVQRALLAGIKAKEVIIIDDGMATLALIKQLTAMDPTALVRARAKNSAARTAMGLAMWHRLRQLARESRLLIVSALLVDEPTQQRMEEVGIKFAQHKFEWLATQPVAERFTEPTLLIGSAMVADGLIHEQPYLEWIASIAEDGPVAYFPHRRENGQLLEKIGRIENLVAMQHTVPIEMRLRALRPGQEIRALPSTVIPSLRLLLGHDAKALYPQPVPDSWWTDSTPHALREHLSSSLKV
ncbi:hypothetical protein AUR04nite_15760 [Glutamicibacter uratoxydans]|uniref:Uncharacterized protein n=1 Tax=Glutamicibacter uratoxydans TaxID=43667 RepID=A0A4Y4DQ59_GLUUR|nr:hypothetical protein [Glutamicibacter uratoxydans]GED06044.1 hypothetical protein AUR04nite_15760 [Glutamicibacter uratoxydans]